MRTLTDELETEKSYADHMAGMAAVWMRRAKEAEMRLAVAVHAAGGEVAIHSGHIHDAPDLVLTQHQRDWDMTTVLRARVRRKQQACAPD